MKGSNFSYLVKQGVVSVWHNRMMSFASFCIMMVSLLLIGLSVLIAMDINIVIGSAEEKNEVLVYVDYKTDQTTLNHIEDVIRSNDNVSNVVFYSADEAWADEQEEMSRYSSEYSKLFDYLDENPMPHTFKVTIADLTRINTTAEQFRSIDGIESVTAPYDYATFLVSMRTTLGLIGGAVLIALIVVCVVIVYNSTRTSVFSRRKEISIMKYVGATNSFIKIPFFIEGMFIGVLAGAASWGLTKLAYEAVVSFFSEDITLWQVLGLANLIPFESVTWIVLGLNCLAGALLGALGTVFSMGKHLKV
ncbi:MAG: cell division protein FtsX [Ruminiclostridium sp.]